MAEYVGLLRAVNVGAANRITMAELRGIFLALGFKNVATYLQSGNVHFGAAGAGAGVKKEIESALSVRFKSDVTAVLRRRAEMTAIVEEAPFRRRATDTAHSFVTFLDTPTRSNLPHSSPSGDLEFVHRRPGEIFSVGRLVKGHYGNPNAFVEKHLKTRATTRNWNVVSALEQGPVER